MRKIFLPLILVFTVMIFAGCDKTTASSDSSPSLITAEEAQAAALADAGYTADEVTALSSRYDRDDGRDEYDVEFFADGFEFDYEIDAKTGSIISSDKDRERPPEPTAETTSVTTAATTATAAAGIISSQEAESIALTHAGLTADKVRGLHSEYDRDHGREEYEVEFYADGYEYDYEINAQTGEIISHNKEWDD